MDRIVLLGAGGHAKSVVDSIEKSRTFEIAGFLDREESGRKVYRSYQIIGQDEDLEEFYQSGIRHAFVCVGFMGNSKVREVLYEKLKAIGYTIPVIVDSSAVIGDDVRIGEGTYIGKNAVLNADSSVGKMCIINTSAIAEHEVCIGDFSHLSVSAVLCGQATVGNYVLIGANSTVIQKIEIGSGSIIGAGSVVLQNVPSSCTVAGIPARIIKRG